MNVREFLKKFFLAAAACALFGTLYLYDQYPQYAFVCLVIFIYCFSEWRVR